MCSEGACEFSTGGVSGRLDPSCEENASFSLGLAARGPPFRRGCHPGDTKMRELSVLNRSKHGGDMLWISHSGIYFRKNIRNRITIWKLDSI